MKHLNRLLVAVLLIVGLSANAQTEDNPWSIKVGVNAVDFHPTNNPGQKTNLGEDAGWFNEFFNAEERWNMPGLNVTVGKYVGSNFSVNFLRRKWFFIKRIICKLIISYRSCRNNKFIIC